MLKQLLRQKLNFDYTIRYSRRKTVAIHVVNGLVEVRAPYHTDDFWIHQFLASKSHWIQDKLAEQYDKRRQMCTIGQGEAFWYLGRRVTLYFCEGSRNQVALEDDKMVIRLRGDLLVASDRRKNEVVSDMLGRWMLAQAKQYMVPRTRALAEQIGLVHRLADVRFRKTRSKWGHCSSRGIIQFNWQIMMAPEAVIHYLMCHEVSHLAHMNHSQAFWHQVAQLCPDYTGQDHWLKENAWKLQWVCAP